ncbi:MAG TPA: IclR family transcriptional regulator [Acidimicrobiales bacterium]|nr:IclR family transcriptional regulator [Acidimicrobiales bacterium]
MDTTISGIGVVDKTVHLLTALEGGPMALGALVEETGIPRATAHRLLRALEHHGLVDRTGGAFLLGPALARMGSAALAASDLAESARPALEQLRDRTGESAQLYLRRGDVRVCVASLESPHSLRTIVPVGAHLPMDRGSAGAVLRDEDAARRRGWAQSVEEREAGVASVSAPVRGPGRPAQPGPVVAAVSVSGPLGRTTRTPGRLYAAAVVEAATAIEAALFGTGRPPTAAAAGAGPTAAAGAAATPRL